MKNEIKINFVIDIFMFLVMGVMAGPVCCRSTSLFPEVNDGIYTGVTRNSTCLAWTGTSGATSIWSWDMFCWTACPAHRFSLETDQRHTSVAASIQAVRITFVTVLVILFLVFCFSRLSVQLSLIQFMKGPEEDRRILFASVN